MIGAGCLLPTATCCAALPTSVRFVCRSNCSKLQAWVKGDRAARGDLV